MRERLISAENGAPTAYVGDRPLHSRYNPQGEAEKYIRALNLSPEIRFFILPEPGLGYILSPLTERFPQAKIIVLHLSDFFTTRERPLSRMSPAPLAGKRPAAVWTPGSGTELQEFLENEIPDTEARTIKIIEWRPSQAAYGEDYLRLLSETADFIKRVDANKRTARGFGRRWVKNFFKNLRLLRRVVSYSPLTRPIIVTGAGPSLEGCFPLIREKKEGGGLILASASSVPALLARSLEPDIVISTDGGGWALFHLYEGLRRGKTADPSFDLAASLNAALPSQCGDLPLLPISDGSLWQDLLLRELNIPFISLPQRGTVTASALDLAFSLTRERVFIAGMDLAHQDIRTHARPYSFERFQEEGASRLYPVYTQSFLRSRAVLSGGSHDIYASWFSRQLAAYPKRLFSLGNNHPLFKGLARPDKEPETGGAGPYSRKFWVNRENLAGRAAVFLLRAFTGEKTAAALAGTLAPLVLPDQDAPDPGQVREALLPLLKGYLPPGEVLHG
ncbi:MAG: DUF115 domain-containing protein [Treponema sp.]|jgi:hypothetical protein|nr:DUF115 domain-containing protein [Treponema sp.]